MQQILIIKTGTTFKRAAKNWGDFEDWIISGLQVPRDRIQVAHVYRHAVLPEPERFSGVVITGSHSMVSDRKEWSEITAQWIRDAVHKEIPLLGICYGHQLLAHAMGGQVGFHPVGPEIGTVQVQLYPDRKSDPLLMQLPHRILAQTCHTQSVLRLPEGSRLLAGNFFEPHHAFRVGICAWGIQFHPEFNAAIMRAYIQEQALALQADGIDLQDLQTKVTETPLAGGLLRRFAQLVTANTES